MKGGDVLKCFLVVLELISVGVEAGFRQSFWWRKKTGLCGALRCFLELVFRCSCSCLGVSFSCLSWLNFKVILMEIQGLFLGGFHGFCGCFEVVLADLRA